MVDTGLLVVLDDSDASRLAVEYAGKLAAHQEGARVWLLQLLPPLPTELFEHGGSENPNKEARLDASLKAAQHRWISESKKDSQKGLDEARSILRRAGMLDGVVPASFCEPAENQDAADAILDEARKRGCGTIIVGRASAPWFQKLLSEPLAHELARRGKEFSVTIVD